MGEDGFLKYFKTVQLNISSTNYKTCVCLTASTCIGTKVRSLRQVLSRKADIFFVNNVEWQKKL